MKRTPLKRKSKSKTKKYQDKLWELCRKIIKLRHGDTCYTCGKTNLIGSNRHTGHMWAKASLGAHLKYDLRILRPQCYHCNINLGGHGAVYYEKMLKEFGQDYMDALAKEKQILVKADDYWYENKIAEYEEIYNRESNAGLLRNKR